MLKYKINNNYSNTDWPYTFVYMWLGLEPSGENKRGGSGIGAGDTCYQSASSSNSVLSLFFL